jgi:peptidoglycan biosynthesis protein MviN/MurJ (putative lipid II flippase)
MSYDAPKLGGQQFITLFYIGIVSLAAIFGYIIGKFGIKGVDPELFSIIQLPPTPVGMAAYGALTIATLLGSILLLVIYVSNRYAEPIDTNE